MNATLGDDRLDTALGRLERPEPGATDRIRANLDEFKPIGKIVLQVAVHAGVPACMNGIAAAKRAFAAVESERPAVS